METSSKLTRRSLLVGTLAGAGVVGAAAFAQRPASQLLAFEPQRPGRIRTGRLISVKKFGASGDGRSDDRPAIQRAIDAVANSGGGTVLFPAGTYLVSRIENSPVAIALKSGVVLQGHGPASVLKLQAGSGGHLVNVTSERNCGIRNMVLDGNRHRQSSTGHVFRSGGVASLRLENLIIRNGQHYGVGLQAGTNRNVVIRNVLIEDCGGDGIDIKNRNNDNAKILMTGVSVRRWGLRRDLQTQSGIDCRGPVRLSGITISDPGAPDAVGVRMRQGGLRDVNGLGAHHAKLNDFLIRMGQGRSQIGVNVVSRSVTVSDGSISGGFRGLVVRDSGFKGMAVRIDGCSDTGILIDAAGSGLDADSAVLSDCTVTNCAGDGIEVEADNVQILRCRSTRSGRHGLSIKITADSARVSGGNYGGNRAGRIADKGRRSHIAF